MKRAKNITRQLLTTYLNSNNVLNNVEGEDSRNDEVIRSE